MWYNTNRNKQLGSQGWAVHPGIEISLTLRPYNGESWTDGRNCETRKRRYRSKAQPNHERIRVGVYQNGMSLTIKNRLVQWAHSQAGSVIQSAALVVDTRLMSPNRQNQLLWYQEVKLPFLWDFSLIGQSIRCIRKIVWFKSNKSLYHDIICPTSNLLPHSTGRVLLCLKF